MKTTVKVLSLLALLVIAAPYGFAKDKAAKTESPKTDATKPKSTPLYAQVDSITPTLLTVKGSGTNLKFVINAETKITKDKAHKEAATTADVKPDQWIGGSYTKEADGTNTLHSLHLAVDQTGGKDKKKKEKAK